MKKIEDILQKYPKCHFLSDGKTIDYEIITKGQLKEFILTFICASCDKSIINDTNKNILEKLKSSDSGCFIKCSCSQSWFLHRPILIPPNLE